MMCAPPQHKMGMSRHVMCKQQAEEWSGLVEYLSFASAASELAWTEQRRRPWASPSRWRLETCPGSQEGCCPASSILH